MIGGPPLLSKVDGEKQVSRTWSGWFTVAFDILFKDKGVDTTSNRPTDGIKAGDYYFDTTLGIPIWYDGTNWIDATGATV